MMMAHSTDDAFLSANGNWSFLLSGAANSTFMERPLIRNDTPSNQATLAQARSFPLIVNAFGNILLIYLPLPVYNYLFSHPAASLIPVPLLFLS